MGADPIPRGTIFVNAYQVWLGKDCLASNGNASLGGEPEAKTWYGATNNLPKLLSTSHHNVWEFYDVVKEAAAKKLTEKAFNSTLLCLNQSMVSIGVLKVQKMMYAGAVMDNDLSIDWIRYCNPGSKEHQEQLKERGLDLDKRAQVAQIVKSFCTKQKILSPLGKHSICLCLSNKEAFDVVIEGYDL